MASALATTLDSSIARVIGPTPPGLGETQPATSYTECATSPASLPSTRETPTSRTAAPGLTISPVMMPGTPAAATTMSASRVCAARSRVPVWHSVTVAFSERRVSSSPSGRPTVTPRPTTTTSAPLISTSWRRSSSTMPNGVQGSGAALPSTSQPRFVGCSPSASLAGSISPRTGFSSIPFGQRQLDDVGGARRVVVEAAYGGQDLVLRRGAGQVLADRLDADLGAVLVLAVDVPRRSRVVADQDRAQPGHDALLAQVGHPLGQLGLDRLRGRGAVELLCGHRASLPGRVPISGQNAGCR